MRAEAAVECLRALCAQVGFNLDLADASLLERMHLLAEHTEGVADAERMVAVANAVFGHYETQKPADAFSEIERRIVVLGALFADVGKTGPLDASPADRALVTKMFAVENVTDDAMPVARFLSTYFPGDAAERVARFVALGLDPSMSIREFWNQHGGWTLAIADAAGLPVECVAAAATHHLLENVNPGSIVDQDGRFTRNFGDNHAFDRAEKLVIVIDKYDALRRRGKRSHEQACAWLRERVAMNPRFRGDSTFETLIADVELVLRDATLG
jgi:hypothetical protein